MAFGFLGLDHHFSYSYTRSTGRLGRSQSLFLQRIMSRSTSNARHQQPHVPQRPLSPTLSSVRDAIAGNPRPRDQDSSLVGGAETPRVNGYSFVDDKEDDVGSTNPVPLINLGPGDANNPFKIQEQRKRETLHERMVDRIAKSNSFHNALKY